MGRHNLEDLVIDDRALKAQVNETGSKGVKQINLTHDRDQW
jgi:hypothetical protein